MRLIVPPNTNILTAQGRLRAGAAIDVPIPAPYLRAGFVPAPPEPESPVSPESEPAEVGAEPEPVVPPAESAAESPAEPPAEPPAGSQKGKAKGKAKGKGGAATPSAPSSGEAQPGTAETAEDPLVAGAAAEDLGAAMKGLAASPESATESATESITEGAPAAPSTEGTP